MEDKHAHERLNALETTVYDHIKSHERFEAAITEIASNTAELVLLVKGAKGVRSFVIWVMPLVAAIGAVWLWIKQQAIS